ncbi:MAG: Ig-like domain-containing protein [Syntrophomonadaceae bacterium]|nr:Ig-like domain-containing protein [Syntrophomonadaceae bacterium]
MNFVSSTPRNGATGVSLNPRIVLTFTLNVVDDTVWANNRNQIRLFRNSNSIAINVTRSTVFDDRHNIYVRPVNSLRPSTDYRLVIQPGLTGNNGNTLGETVTIRFRTKAGVRPEE